MKTQIILIASLLIGIILPVGVLQASNSYRVQCHSDNKSLSLEDFNKIPERQSYKLASGKIIYFSGGFYQGFEDAKSRLAKLNEKGIEGAFIRVFDNTKYLSKPVSDYLLGLREKKTLSPSNKLSTTIAFSDNVNHREQVTSVSNALEIDIKNLEGLSFKVVLLKVKSDQPIQFDFNAVKQTLNKYSYNGYAYVTSGDFKTVAEANTLLVFFQKRLPDYKIEINGFYKGMLFSEDVAIGLMNKVKASE